MKFIFAILQGIFICWIIIKIDKPRKEMRTRLYLKLTDINGKPCYYTESSLSDKGYSAVSLDCAAPFLLSYKYKEELKREVENLYPNAEWVRIKRRMQIKRK